MRSEKKFCKNETTENKNKYINYLHNFVAIFAMQFL